MECPRCLTFNANAPLGTAGLYECEACGSPFATDDGEDFWRGERGETRHADDCDCEACRNAFDAVMWGWLRPEHVAIVERWQRTGDYPVA